MVLSYPWALRKVWSQNGHTNVWYLVVIILTVGIIKVINSYVLLFPPLLELASEKAAQAQSWTLTVNLAKVF